jgi:hypothetical protein
MILMYSRIESLLEFEVVEMISGFQMITEMIEPPLHYDTII